MGKKIDTIEELYKYIYTQHRQKLRFFIGRALAHIYL